MDTFTCLCGDRRLMTVREVASLPVLAHFSESTLHRMIDVATLPARRLGPRKTLLLVTQHCPAHQTKAPDDLDAFVEATTPRPARRR